MTREYAEEICGWKYAAPYDFYNMEYTEEALAEFLNGEFYVAIDSMGNRFGFFCFGHAARVPGGYAAGIYQDEERTDVGLGMAPSFTGRGLGRDFVAAGLEHGTMNLGLSKFRLVVASFNLRAIEVYRRNGFQSRNTSLSDVHGKPIQFLHMEK
ncbi:GNAT family N-acetyltransferase [Cohnella pontilimi]|nr:GNAT family N-acetyltransferase [Cohnella pontilimi]